MLPGEFLTKYFFKGKDNEALKLEHLNLAYNSMSSLPEDLFFYLTNLISLDLGYNPLSFLTKETISAISQLRKLQVSKDELGYTFPFFFLIHFTYC